MTGGGGRRVGGRWWETGGRVKEWRFPLKPASDTHSRVTSFTGRVAVVTGGTKGIGRAVAARFEAAGAAVVTLARTEPAQAVGRFIAADLASPPDIAAAFKTIAHEFGRVDVLVNNAGGARPGRALDYP